MRTVRCGINPFPFLCHIKNGSYSSSGMESVRHAGNTVQLLQRETQLHNS